MKRRDKKPAPPRILGIDPGVAGGLAILEGMVLAETKKTDTKKVSGKTIIDARETMDWIETAGAPDVVVIEQAISMPNQAVSSTMMVGRNLGILDAISQLLSKPVFWVHPRTWKSHFHVSANKRESLRLASELFGEDAYDWAPMSSNGVAEAALIALWWVQKNSGGTIK